VVDEPVQVVDGHIAMDVFENRQGAVDGLIVRSVQSEGPAMLSEQADDALELALQVRRHVGPRFTKILEVRGGIHQHFTRPVVSIEMVSGSRKQGLRPGVEIIELPRWPLGEEVVGNPCGQKFVAVKRINDLIIFRKVQESSARIDDAGDAESIQLTHKLPGGVALVGGTQSWSE
jgi:hypothetical protein